MTNGWLKTPLGTMVVVDETPESIIELDTSKNVDLN